MSANLTAAFSNASLVSFMVLNGLLLLFRFWSLMSLAYYRVAITCCNVAINIIM